jgi:DNA polymerase III subunit epsilon
MNWQRWFRWRPWSQYAPHTKVTERWVVLDVETSSLDTARAQLLSIACVAVQINWQTRRLSLTPGDSFEVYIQPETPITDKANILLHGMGQQRQAQGLPKGQALQQFTDYVGSAPLLAFHASFDERILKRHLRTTLGQRLSNPWVDIAPLCAAALPKTQAQSLDEWLAYLGIICTARHQAAADTWAECEVLQRIWPILARQCTHWRDVQLLASQQRWMA